MVSSREISGIRPEPHAERAALARMLGAMSGIPTALRPPWRQYAFAFVVFLIVTLINFALQKWIGYQAIALVYLLSVVLLALVINQGATVFGTVLTAAGWNFFFAPPAFAFN